ncbi:conserved hypothetical protein [Theileria equi strain WA]|uniref:Bromo domain-containing protein n=1 Tax=Theileria equi strain WA TaxID=1537102 RepID=L1LEJ6_THEEQ|nr:conserved hypothetical protein [Theileria equi strain WA]EKX73847.1 conserved hypothetical protein [Theileria equi strain WA]|eukprot:XP_004833299.1 conserved hypothetical protein [Theileria equi strain WA]
MSAYHESYVNNPLIKALVYGTLDEFKQVLDQRFKRVTKEQVDQETSGAGEDVKAEQPTDDASANQTGPIPVTIEELIEPNTKITPLCQLSHKSHEESLEIAKLLIEDYRLCNPNHVDLIGQTCMFYAARDGRTELCSYFAKNGCNPNHKDKLGQTCMFYAARDGHANVLDILISHGADVNITDTNNQTCLFYAARDGRVDAVKLLLEKKVNASWKDHQRRTALTFAKAKGHAEIIALLKKGGSSIERSGSGLSTASKRSISEVDIPIEATGPTSGVPLVLSTEVPQKPKRYRLQYRPFADDEKLWLDAPLVKVQEFELRFPDLAKWDKEAPFPPATTLKNPMLKQWYSLAQSLLATLLKQEGGYVFDKPVDPKKQNCPDYYDIIKNPMSFSCIRGKLRKYLYVEPQQFIDDVLLIFDNCYKYNKPDTWIASIGHALENFFKQQLIVLGFNDFCTREQEIKRLLQEAQDFVASHSNVAPKPVETEPTVPDALPKEQEAPVEIKQDANDEETKAANHPEDSNAIGDVDTIDSTDKSV